jgi:hypothetical protein
MWQRFSFPPVTAIAGASLVDLFAVGASAVSLTVNVNFKNGCGIPDYSGVAPAADNGDNWNNFATAGSGGSDDADQTLTDAENSAGAASLIDVRLTNDARTSVAGNDGISGHVGQEVLAHGPN